MKTYSLVLKLCAPVFFIVAALHLLLGVGADVQLGAALPPAALADPVLDSQNRFYGVSFAIYGVLILLASTDLLRYRVVLQCLLWTFFAAGIARFASFATHGVPTATVLALLVTEIVLPPVLLLWFSRLPRAAPQTATLSA